MGKENILWFAEVSKNTTYTLRTIKALKGDIRMMLSRMWGCVGKCVFLEFAKGFADVRNQVRLARARVNIQRIMTSREMVRNIGNMVKFSPNITVTWVTRMTR